ncbi:MAG TPA: hypothetical protein VGI40_09655 [Pirellulaceae bacterium]|jgi:hypothetical protein
MSFVVQQLTDPSVQLCAWVLIGMVAAELLVAIWAAVGPQHWFWRGLGLWGTVMVMAPLEAWQVMWVLVFAAGFIGGIVQLARASDRLFQNRLSAGGQAHLASSTKQNEPVPDGSETASEEYRLRRLAAGDRSAVVKYRYSLRDLLLLVFLICLWLPGLAAAGREASGANWLGLIAAGAVWAGLAVLAANLVFGPRRVRAAVLLAVALPLGAIAITRTLSPGDYWWFTGAGGTYWEMTASVGIVGMELVLVLVVVMRLVCVIRSTAERPARRWFSAAALTALAGLAAPVLGYVYWELLQRPPRVVKFELAGNQFARICEIARRVHAINPGNVSIGELRRPPANKALADELAALYAELLPLLAAENAALYDPTTDATAKYSADYFGATLQQLRGLCRSLQAEAEWHRSHGQPAMAAEYGLGCLGLSESMGRGGTAIDALVSRALEGVSYAELAKVRGKLSADKLREVLAVLARDAERRDDIQTVRGRELDYSNRAAGFMARAENTLLKLTSRKSPWEESLRAVSLRLTVENALLRAEMAAQLFKHEKTRWPGSLEKLVPEYLPTVPIDAYSGQPLRCRAEESGLLIYSVGRDGMDDGGVLTTAKTYWSNKSGYDYDLNTLTQ